MGQPGQGGVGQDGEVTHSPRPVGRLGQSGEDEVLKESDAGVTLQLGVEDGWQFGHHCSE